MLRRYSYAWILIGLVAIVDAVWAPVAGVAITGLWLPAIGIVSLGIIAAFYHATHRDDRIASFAAFVALLIGFTSAAAPLSYLVLTLRRPPADAVFARLDAMLGFDWIAWSDAVAARPWLGALLFAAYWSLFPVIIATLIFLTTARRTERCLEFTWAIMLSALVAIAVCAVLPTMSPPFWYGVPERANLAGTLRDLLALYDGSFRVLRLSAANGLIQFPSYHATLAILVCHALRGTRYAFCGALILAGLILLSIPSVGMHYLVDIPGGAVDAIASILIVRRCLQARPIDPVREVPRPRPRQRPRPAR